MSGRSSGDCLLDVETLDEDVVTYLLRGCVMVEFFQNVAILVLFGINVFQWSINSSNTRSISAINEAVEQINNTVEILILSGEKKI